MYIDLFKSQPVSEIKLKKKTAINIKPGVRYYHLLAPALSHCIIINTQEKKIVSNMQNNANIVATVNITITD